MMKTVWLNLPVKDLNKSKAFFARLGFSFDTEHGNSADSGCFMVGEDKFHVLLFPENTFKGFTKNELADAGKATEVLISLGAESREEVDQLAQKAAEAGGNLFGQPSEIHGCMYGCGFTDLDGHRWNVLYMDMSKMK